MVENLKIYLKSNHNFMAATKPFKIKSGDKFKGVIKGIHCQGKIQVYNRYLYFCTNNSRLDGEGCSNGKLGYKYSWIMDSHVDSISIEKQIRKLGKIIYQFIPVQIDKIDEYVDKPLTVAEYAVNINGNIISLGCGAVQFTKQNLKDFIRINKKLKSDPALQAYLYIIGKAAEYDVELDSRVLKELENILK